jgi:hypothetical protein
MVIHYILLLTLHLISINACKTSPQDDKNVPATEDLPLEQNLTIKAPAKPQLKKIAELPKQLTECSGMIVLGDKQFVAHNDSGNKPYLYVFTAEEKNDARVVKVLNVSNNDWEELAEDDDYIYIGDFGNNGGTRQNLMIYKVKKSDLKNNDQVIPEIIKFRYGGQTKYSDSNRHNFDCEAMIVKGDSLFLFSKNRGDFRTDVYGLPKTPGDYVTQKLGSFDSEGLVTGADYRQNGSTGELVLVGYSIHGKAFYPFILYFPKVEGSGFLSGEVHKHNFSVVLQTESISFHGQDKVYLTNEEEDDSEGMIYEASLKN